MSLIAVVDDDFDIRELLSEYLRKNGYQVSAFESAEALLEVGSGTAELLVLDVTLPGIDGLELCKRVRETSNVPIIMLTAASDDIDRILGLELGADDYMGKPFNPRELLARIKALLRRAGPVSSVSSNSDLSIDLKARNATFKGSNLNLTGAEFDLLAVLFEQQGAVVSRDSLSLSLKGRAATPYDRSIDTQVSRLRAKLVELTETDPIKAVRGKGYSLVLS